MKIALVVPTYKAHFIYLERLCRNAAEQTRLPDLVVIRASSCDTDEARAQLSALSEKAWPFPLKILETSNQQYQAQNRNEGVAAVPPDFDAVSFFDSDDLMHPRRLELIESLFLQGAEAVIHDCQKGNSAPIWEHYDTVHHVWDSILLQKESAIQRNNQIVSRSVIIKQYTGTVIPTGYEITFLRPIPMDEHLEDTLGAHFGHVSVLLRIMKDIRFDLAALGYEDAKFVSDIVYKRHKTASLIAKLSYYTLHTL